MSLDDLTIAEIRRELARLVAMADTSERPKPDVINEPGHPMAGHEWHVVQDAPYVSRPPLWVVRTVDEPETRDCVYVAQPDPYLVADWERWLDFIPMRPVDARRLAMVLLAAAHRVEHLDAGVPRLEDRRNDDAR